MNLLEYLLLIAVAVLVYSAWLTKHLSRNRARSEDAAPWYAADRTSG